MKKRILTFISLAILMSAFVGCESKSKENSEIYSKFESPDGFRVLNVFPEDELPAAVKYPQIQIQFSEPVVALQKLGTPMDKVDFVSIQPEIKGIYRWYGTSLLSFEADSEVIPLKEYKITIDPNLVSVTGNKLKGQNIFSFYSESLKLINVVAGYEEVNKGEFVDQNDLPAEMARDIAVYFNANVNARYIEKSISVYEEKTALGYKLEQLSPNSVRIKLNEAPKNDKDITVVVKENALADEGAIPTAEEQTSTFHTLRQFIVDNFEENARWYVEAKCKNPIMFRFNHQLKMGTEEEIAKQITTEPPMEITPDNLIVNGKTLTVHSLPVSYGMKYQITLSSRIKDAYGFNLKEESFQVEVPEANSFAYFKDYGFKMLEAGFDPKIAFQFQNINSDKSYYSINDANGGQEFVTNMADRNFELNTPYLEGVDLRPVLSETDNGWLGAAFFDSKISYNRSYKDWRTGEKIVEEDTVDNEQLIQVTNLGVTVRYGYNKIAVLVTSLKTGLPVEGAEVNAYMLDYNIPKSSFFKYIKPANRITGPIKTDKDGFAILEVPADTFDIMERLNRQLWIEAKTDVDCAIFQPDLQNMWRFDIATGYPSRPEKDVMVTFMFTDRGLYKPGETLTFRVIDRNLNKGEYKPYVGKATIEITNGSWNPVVYHTYETETTENGTTWGNIKIPQDMKPGNYSLKYTRLENGRKTFEQINFQVEFFQRLRFEANATIPQITYYSGDTLNGQISANYLGGGSMGGAGHEAFWSREPIGFYATDPKYEDMTFGPLQAYDGRTSLENSEGVLDADGKSTTSQKTGGEKLKGIPYRYKLQASVTDAGNQMVSTNAYATVHPAKFYVGIGNIKGLKGFPKKGDTLKFDYACVTPASEQALASDLPNNRKLKIELTREDWKQVQQIGWNGQINTRYEREMITEVEKTIDLSVTGGEISVVPPKGGAYILRASTFDSKHNEVITEKRFYVTSSDWYSFNRYDAEEITLTPNKSEYSVGEKAFIMMQSQLPEGRYLITVEREGLVSEEVRVIKEPTSVIEIDVTEEMVPVMYVSVSGYSKRNGEPAADFDTPDINKPKSYFGVTAINVNTAVKRFDIKIEKSKPSYKPGEEAEITITATKDGKPVENAEVTLMAVDRGVIDLIDYHVPDPIEQFYSKWLFGDCCRGGDNRSILIDPVNYEIKNLMGGDSDLELSKSIVSNDSKMEERKNFDPTAVFVPSIATDSNGKATIKFVLPDTLTAYRVTAVGVDANNFALQESQIDVANEISVREVLPRLLRIGDKGETGVTITNLSPKDQTVSITLEVEPGVNYKQNEDEVQKIPGLVSVKGESTKSITVPSNSTGSLMFNINGEKSGWSTLKFTVNSEIVNEKILQCLEVQDAFVWETVATTGIIKNSEEKESSVIEKIIIPKLEGSETGDLDIKIESNCLGTLSESVNYVFRYPYGCFEQKSSRIIPLAAFKDYIKIFGIEREMVNPSAVIKKELAFMGKYQHKDGGFPYWKENNHSSLFPSIAVGEALAIAKENGCYKKDSINEAALASYLLGEAQNIVNKKSINCYLSAYSYYVAQRLGKDVPKEYLDELMENDYCDINTMALVGLTHWYKGNEKSAQEVAQKIRRYIKLTTRGVDLTSAARNQYVFFLNARSSDLALLLKLYSLTGDLDLCSRIVYELLRIQSANHGRFGSTAVVGQVLASIDVFLKSFDFKATDFDAIATLGAKEVLRGKFKGINKDVAEVKLGFKESPVKEMGTEKEIPLEIKKDGNGNLFYTASMHYTLPIEQQNARDEGFSVYAEIFNVKTGQRVNPGKLVAGEIYREKLYITTTKDREYVALRAPIPAGCEVMNAAFTTTGEFEKSEEYQSEDYNFFDSWYYNGLSHQEIYDAEVQYFWDFFRKGSQQVEFLFRAVRKGDYVNPSAKAECMYQEEIFGRTQAEKWTIE